MSQLPPSSISDLLGLPTASSSQQTNVTSDHPFLSRERQLTFVQQQPLSVDFHVDPDDYPSLAGEAQLLPNDLRTTYANALSEKEEAEREEDGHYLSRAREYVELNEQVQASKSLLVQLSSFLSTFQHDLFAVSGHISELQNRSKTIEARLLARKAVERSLHPLLGSIGISPGLIKTIMDTEVDDAWITSVTELDAKLGAIRSGPRVEARKDLDQVAESLRIEASHKILAHFLQLIRPFSGSVTVSLPDLQTSSLLPLKPLFDFLRRHAARQAHEFQKAYVSTIRWYYETAFRRYVRALEKIRSRGTVEKSEPIGVVVLNSENTLALISASDRAEPAIQGGDPKIRNLVENSRIEGADILPASFASDKLYRTAPEVLFRSISLVLMDNAALEHAFVTTFFGQHSTIPIFPSERSQSPSLFPARYSKSPTSEPTSREPSESGQGNEVARSTFDTESMMGSEFGGPSLRGLSREERQEKLRMTVVDTVWKSIMEPAQEYVQDFVVALVDPLPPSSPSIYAMIRLNEAILEAFSTPLSPPMETHFIGLRIQLWPVFSKAMDAHIESVRKINGTLPTGGVFGGKGTGSNVKDSVVRVVMLRYAELFNSFVALANQSDELMVFSTLLRLRQEIDNLLVYQAQKMPDPQKKTAFLSVHYEQLIKALSDGLTTSSQSQGEIAHFKELLRRLDS